ncbi:MAG: MBOAT family protein [Acidobacteriota bacterium]|nr:MBOAT family protein [Acidobacteriota bacterium]
MVFSSIIFLFFFLPLALALYLACPKRLRNLTLLLVSLVFYAWGEGFFVLLMLTSITINYLSGLALERFTVRRKLIAGLSIAANLTLLAFYKYAGFLAANLDPALQAIGLPPVGPVQVHLPIGISFFTFQALSYVIDVYRGRAPVQRNPLNLALYIAMFPQLIAGPIVRYGDVAAQITRRVLDRELFASGIRRFAVGLAKKVLIANVLGSAADQIFLRDYTTMDPATAWLGIICYTFQIYFDFSGYSDMAVGLGRMFGFRFLENFNYPYISRSIREFWRRWHISLSTWFRDYLYIPLGGNRTKPLRVYFNLTLVFFLCGLWHGAGWNFIIWGLLHGLLLVIERSGFGRLLGRLWRPLQHLYVLSFVILAWVFFRIETLPDALTYLDAMLNPYHTAQPAPAFPPGRELLLTLILAAIGSTPIMRAFWEKETQGPLLPAARVLLTGSLLCLCAVYLAAGTYNPFIYFRF